MNTHTWTSKDTFLSGIKAGVEMEHARIALIIAMAAIDDETRISILEMIEPAEANA